MSALSAGRPGSTRFGPEVSRKPVFVTTHWSVVLAAGRSDTAHARQALEQLCRVYWYPLYAFVRRLGHSPEDSEDLTQEFFARLLSKSYLRAADPERGRFRTFLLVAFKRFLANEWDRLRAEKRGGGRRPLSLDTDAAEQRYAVEPADTLSADRIYERRWALTLVSQAMTRLKGEFEMAGKSAEYELLKEFLTERRAAIPYHDVAVALGRNEGAARAAVHRLRRRFRELFREEIAQTVTGPDEIEGEIRHLMAVLAA